VQKCQQEVEEPGIASQHHKNPPLTHCCVRGRWRSTGAHDGAYTLASHGRDSRPSPRLRVRWQGPRSAVCTGVGAVRPCIGSIDPALGVVDLVLGHSTSCCPVQPCMIDRTPVGLFNPALDVSTLRSAFFVLALGWPHALALVRGSR
jgi:hypothetical protein